MNMVETMRFHVAFDDADSEGIVFFGNYFRLAHRALERWLPMIGIAWNDWFARPDGGIPLRHAEADFLGPLRPGQEFEIKVSVAKLGESSVSFAYEFLSLEGHTLARLKTAHVFVERQPIRKMAIPEGLRASLNATLKSP